MVSASRVAVSVYQIVAVSILTYTLIKDTIRRERSAK